MSQTSFQTLLAQHFGHTYTPEQSKASAALEEFLYTSPTDGIFCLRGYAGTGKTSLVAALVRTLQDLGRQVVLLAPTGRAAKVFSGYAGRAAHTIHRVIYRQETFRGEDTRFQIGYNKLRRALFVVDEASMINMRSEGSTLFGQGNLLDDLVQYVYSGDGCRLLLVGDTAQLPPVGEEHSPALQIETFLRYGLTPYGIELTEVVRQAHTSMVLHNATRLRCRIDDPTEEPLRIQAIRGDGELKFLPSDELIEALITAYSECGTDEVIVITRSNNRANIYNQGIRARVFDREEVLSRGDQVMAVKNNYFWTEQWRKTLAEGETMPLNFIANGDIAQVVRIRNIHEQHGFTFADATLKFVDFDDYELDCRVLLNTLSSASPSLTQEESHRLYEQVLLDYADIPSQKERMKMLRADPYYNALQIKFAYAVTCHKAQGGGWEQVFVDQGPMSEEEIMHPSHLRWLYTALTRTSDKLYLVNWPKEQQWYIEKEELQK